MDIDTSSLSAAHPTTTPVVTPSTPPSVDAKEQLRQLYDQGLYLQAFKVSEQFGPLQEWTDPEMQVLGGRMAHNLGADRLGRVMHRAAHRQAPQNPIATYFYILSMSSRWGMLETWNRINRFGDVQNGDVEITADWFALKAMTLAGLRDFEAAEESLNEAMTLQPERAWVHVCRTYLLEQQDRPEEALQSAIQAMHLRPWYRPAVQNLAYRLVQMNRDQDALDLLGEAINRLESGDLRMQFGALLLELQMYEEAREVYSTLDQYMPLRHFEPKRNEWLAARRADAAYHCGDFTTAITEARKAESSFYTSFAEQMESKEEKKRVVLPVKFVRQNHSTCAPATLSAVTSFWGMEAEHLELAEEICLDGTPAHSERRWANSNGFVTKEFRVTEEVATELINRGVPFTLTTVDPGSAHLQAVIGYDQYRRSLIIRDPGERHHDEFPLKEMLEHYAPCGPRGMALVPTEKAELLEGVEFPEAEYYDILFEVEVALEAHNREQAETLVNKMREMDATHRLTLRGRGTLAHYDGNTNELLAILDAMLEKFPTDINSKMSKLACLGQLGRREERVAMLEALIAEPDCDPVFWSRYAAELVDDARQREKALYHLHRAARCRPHDVAAYDLLASIEMDQQNYEEATNLYRIAACLAELNERQTQAYFFASRAQNQANTALRFILDRVERFGKKSSQPTQTLCWALDQLERTTDALKVLEKAHDRHPEDGDLLLYMAQFFGRYGKLGHAWKLLEKAEGKCHQNAWERTAASLAHCEGELEEALKHWLTVIEAEPLDANAHRFAVELLGDTDSEQAAIAHLKKYVRRFPHSYDLNMLLIESLDDPDEKRSQLQQFLERNPSDAWGLRELAFLMIGQRESEGVFEIVDRAEQIEPKHPSLGFIRGRVERERKNFEQAKIHFQQSLQISVDYDFSIMALLDCCQTKVEREAALEFLYRELQSQVIFGDGLLAYQQHAAGTLEAADLLQRLQEVRNRRPDLWHAWSAEIRQLSNMQRHDEALALAEEATTQFRLLPRIWLDLAAACGACGKIDGEIAAIQQAKTINPTWGEPARLLSEAYEKKGDLDSARAEIERVIVSEPRDVRNHGFLAGLMWQQEQQQEAIDTLVHAVKMEPAYMWGWSALREWSLQLDQYEMVVQVTRELTEERPNDYRPWLLYAESLAELDNTEQALKALDRAIQISPNCTDAYNQKSYVLSRAGQFDEALEATRPAAFGDNIPLELQARASWVEGERGNIETAVALMERVIEQDQDYFWAWHRLAEWYEYLNLEEKYFAAAQHMVRLEPQSPVSWGYLGDGELRKENFQQAKEHFRQAVQLSPDYSFASSRLIDLQLEDKEFDAAQETLEIISPHIPEAWHLSEKIRIESLRGDQQAAFGLLRKLAVTESTDPTAIDSAVESIWHAKWGEMALPLIDSLMDVDGAQPGVAYVFVNLSSTLERWEDCERRLLELNDRPEMQMEGVRKYIEELASEDQLPRLHAFVEKYFQYLHQDNNLWETVGDAYNAIDEHKMALKWMNGWETRGGLTASQALTVACAFWRLQMPHDAAHPTRFAMENLSPDESCGPHLALLAFYELIWGSAHACIELVGMLDVGQLPPQYHLLYQYTVTVLENFSTDRSYGATAKQLKEIFHQLPDDVQKIPYFRWQYQLIAWRAAVIYGKSLRAMWLKWQI